MVKLRSTNNLLFISILALTYLHFPFVHCSFIVRLFFVHCSSLRRCSSPFGGSQRKLGMCKGEVFFVFSLSARAARTVICSSFVRLLFVFYSSFIRLLFVFCSSFVRLLFICLCGSHLPVWLTPACAARTCPCGSHLLVWLTPACVAHTCLCGSHRFH